ncbi:MAG: hypothetical protein Kow001_18100 [Acidobacteriota bacterium]
MTTKMLSLSLMAGWILTPVPTAAQTGDVPFDQAAMRREIAVMESIVSTSLRNELAAADEAEALDEEMIEQELMASGRVEGIYLYRQGVVFTIGVQETTVFPLGRLDRLQRELEASLQRNLDPELLESYYLMAQSQLEDLQHQLQEVRERWGDLLPPGHPAPVPEAPLPPEPALPPEPEAAPDPAMQKAREEALRQNLRLAQERLAAMRRNAAEINQRRQETLARIETLLVDIIARYGDSLTQLKPEEHLTFILRPSSHFGFELGRDAGRTTVFTVRKQDITAYRSSGDLATLRSRIVRYTQ